MSESLVYDGENLVWKDTEPCRECYTNHGCLKAQVDALNAENTQLSKALQESEHARKRGGANGPAPEVSP